jgi:P27 family predicted phage terminase small subunit
MAVGGRRPKPNHLKLVTGNPGKRPIPKDNVEPPPRSRPLSPPPEVRGTARNEWKRLAPVVHRLGLLSDLDRGPFAAYCISYGRWRDAEEALQREDLVIKTSTGAVIQNPLLGISNRAMREMMRYAVEFGFTPSARSRVHDNAPKSAKSAAGKAPAQQFFDD